MKPTDLMLEDWVLWKNRYVQIVRTCSVVYSFGHRDVWLAHCNDDNVIECHDMSQISPIPLTPEILEKNGWERDIDKEWEYNNSHILPHYCYQWEKRNVKIEMYSGLEGFTISLIIGRRFYAVHELQHVLRLYGLDELADNFKV